MADFGGRVAVLEEIAGHLRGTSHLAGSLEAEDEEIHDSWVRSVTRGVWIITTTYRRHE